MIPLILIFHWVVWKLALIRLRKVEVRLYVRAFSLPDIHEWECYLVPFDRFNEFVAQAFYYLGLPATEIVHP